MKNSKNSFVFYTEWHEILMQFSGETRLQVYDAIVVYCQRGEVPELTGEARMAFEFIRRQLDKNDQRYQEITEKRREAAHKRWSLKNVKNNKPSHDDANASCALHDGANDAVYDNDNVDDNDNDNVNDNVDNNSLRSSLSLEETRARFKQEVVDSTIKREQLCCKHSIDQMQYDAIAREILTDWEIADARDWSWDHFAKVFRYKVKELKKPATVRKSTASENRRSHMAAAAQILHEVNQRNHARL